MARRSKVPLVAILVGLLVAGTAGAFAFGIFGPHSLSPAEKAALRAAAARAAARKLLAKERVFVTRATGSITAALPSVLGDPAPATPTALFVNPLPAHQVLGFVPYWEMSSLSSLDYADATTLSYFSLELAASGDGSLKRSGPGWNDLQSSGFLAFHANARAAGDRVLLTISTTSKDLIDALVASPDSSSSRLSGELEQLVSTFGFDGVDIDIEGRGATNRAAFVRFMTDLTAKLRLADPGGEIVLDTYPQSASSSGDFFNVTALAPLVDQLFVMAYDMYDGARASANSPIYSPSLGFSEIQTLLDYAKLVPPAKTIVGLPFYGLDFTTAAQNFRSRVTKPYPVAVTYSAIVAVNRAAHWDPASASPFTSFKRGTSWHETWYDDPTSLALKASLASQFHVAGIGAFALGQEGTDSAMLQALTGGAPPIKLSLRAGTGGG